MDPNSRTIVSDSKSVFYIYNSAKFNKNKSEATDLLHRDGCLPCNSAEEMGRLFEQLTYIIKAAKDDDSLQAAQQVFINFASFVGESFEAVMPRASRRGISTLFQGVSQRDDSFLIAKQFGDQIAETIKGSSLESYIGKNARDIAIMPENIFQTESSMGAETVLKETNALLSIATKIRDFRAKVPEVDLSMAQRQMAVVAWIIKKTQEIFLVGAVFKIGIQPFDGWNVNGDHYNIFNVIAQSLPRVEKLQDKLQVNLALDDLIDKIEELRLTLVDIIGQDEIILTRGQKAHAARVVWYRFLQQILGHEHDTTFLIYWEGKTARDPNGQELTLHFPNFAATEDVTSISEEESKGKSSSSADSSERNT